MKLAQTASIVLLCALWSGIPFGCSTVHKVKRTLALNDLQIQASIAEQKGDDDQAYELWTQYIDRRPQSALAEYRLGKVETRLGLIDQAILHLRIAHDLKPAKIDYLLTLADAMVQGNRIDSLISLLQETINEGEEGSGNLRLAHYAEQVGLMDQAHEALQMAIVENRGRSPAPYLALANFAHTVGNHDEEIKNLRNFLWFHPSDPEILNRLDGLDMIAGPSLALQPDF